MYFLGWLSFFQITFLPGFLFLEFLKMKTKTLIEKIIFIFALSLIVNFVLVFLLTLLRLYQPVVIYLFFSFEFICFFLTIVRKKLIFRLSLPLNQTGLLTIALLTALLVVGRFFILFFQNLSLRSVFLTGDTLDSWNRWASQWFQNQIPVDTLIAYPQLIPTNWSLTYVFMQTTQIELFAKLLMPLFSIAILLIFFDLAGQTKKIAYIFGAIITGGLLHYYFDTSFLRDGYPDIAFAFFAFLPFYCLQLFQKYKQKEYLPLMILFALGSFLTKQLGFYIVLLTLITPSGWSVAPDNKLKNLKKPLFLFSFFLLAIAIFWYVLKLPEIITAYNIESIYHAAMSSKLNDLSFFSRLTQSVRILAPNIKGIVILAIVTLLLLLSLFQKTSAKVIVFIIFPFFVLWSLFLNYDVRNLAVIFPYIGLTSGTSLDIFFHYNVLKHCNKAISLRANGLVSFFIFITLLGLVSFFISNERLIYYQTEGKKQIGIPELNSRLYDYYYKNGFDGKIATSYYRLCNLPEIGKFCYYSQQFNNVTMNQSNIKYYLYPKNKIKNIDNKNVIFDYNGWIFVSTLSTPQR